MKRSDYRRVPSVGDLESSDQRFNLDKSTKRTTKISQKLALFPTNAEDELTTPIQPLDDDVPRSKRRIETERMLAALDKALLPRVTGYCVANAFDMTALLSWLVSCKGKHKTAPKRFDEAIYTPFTNIFTVREDVVPQTTPPLVPIDEEESTEVVQSPYARLGGGIGQIFFFEYGALVCFGLSEKEERFIIRQIEPFMEEPLKPADVETEDFRFTYNANYQPRIWNDIILLKNPQNYMLLLTIAHAIGQSCKLALFEELVETTINRTRGVPEGMAATGTVALSSSQITRLIGQLFMLRINVNLVSNVVDTPEVFWSEPALEPFYKASRHYLELNQRIDLLNQRVGVLSDLLEMLKDHLEASHGEQLEWIVICLIAVEILVAIATIVLDSME